MDKPVYNSFSDYLKKRYGEKVYKLPVALPVTCPNRDGSIKLTVTSAECTLSNGASSCDNSVAGCTFCGSIGAGYENLPGDMTITQQLAANKIHIVPKYKAKKFIPYFQNFSNTYAPPDVLRGVGCRKLEQGRILPRFIFATRPDCISDEYLAMLKGAGRGTGC